VKLTGELVELRDFRLDDAGAVPTWTSDPEVARFMTWDADVGDGARAVQFVERQMALADERPRAIYELAMVERSTGLIVGGAGLRVRDWRDQRADLGYVLRRDRWGRGYTTDAVRLLIALGFELGMHRIEATCFPDNRASARVMEKNGLRFEGQMRHVHFVRGQWRDALLYAIIVGEVSPAR